MTREIFAVLLVSLAVLAYLVYTLLRPEEF